MTDPRRPQAYRPERIDPRATIAAMRSKAATPEALARVEALERRWNVPAPKSADEQQAAAVRSERSGRNKRAGMAAETRAKQLLQADGWTVQRSQDSQGAADLIARRDGASTRWIQIKHQVAFASWGANDAIARFLGMGRWQRKGHQGVGPGERREAWLFLWNQGLVARVVLDHYGQLVKVDGREPYRTKVESSIRTMLARQGRAGSSVTTTAQTKRTTQ